MQVAEVGTYQITLYKNNDGLWDFWIKQKGHLLVKSTGTGDCQETKLLVQKHLYDIVMTKKEKKDFDPNNPLEWRNYLRGADGDTRNPWLAIFRNCSMPRLRGFLALI